MACTINTRYEDAAVTDMINLAHFPKTVVLYVYENNSNQHHIGRTLQDSGNEILRQGGQHHIPGATIPNTSIKVVYDDDKDSAGHGQRVHRMSGGRCV